MRNEFLLMQMVGFLAIATAIAIPTLRRKLAGWVLALGGAGLLGGVALSGETFKQDITHHFSAYEQLHVVSKAFPIETVSAPCWQSFTLCALFCFGWGGWLRWGQTAAPAFGAPGMLAFSGVALQLVLEKVAAPLAPFDLAPDRVLFPATLAGAYLLARSGRKILHLVLYLSLFIAVTRLPIALFGTLATRGAWGTHLDVHNTVFFVPPGGATSIGAIEVEPGSAEQLFWLIWAPHLIVYPLFYMMSTGGFAFLHLMWLRQKEVDAAAPTPSAGVTSS